MIHVLVEVERNTKNVVVENSGIRCEQIRQEHSDKTTQGGSDSSDKIMLS